MTHAADPLQSIIVDLCQQSAPAGVTMGALVDKLVEAGYPEQRVEMVIWNLLGQRRLTPNGFVRRQLRRSPSAAPGDSKAAITTRRCYEWTLVPWDPTWDLPSPPDQNP